MNAYAVLVNSQHFAITVVSMHVSVLIVQQVGLWKI